MTVRGSLIAVEGGEGSGKSTQAALLASAIGAVLTREPGGTPAAERIRELVLDRSLAALAPRTELLLVCAARAEHVAGLIGPALATGRSVVTDRFAGSTLAYQGYGRGLPLAEVWSACELAADGLSPDLSILVDLDPAIAASRRCGRPDRIEAEDGSFFARVDEGFRALAAADPSGWAVVDGLGSEEEVAARVLSVVRARLGPVLSQ